MAKVEAREILRVKRAHDVSYHAFSELEKVGVRKALLTWYDGNKRDLPWRQPHGIACKISPGQPREYPADAQRAYEVWISEIMLQQTRVQTVVTYYNKWMHSWPTIFDLAGTSLAKVNEMWAGLGYYSRARRIHEAAGMVVEERGGVLPRTATELAARVPGVGRYTAGAVASIAYGERAEVVDGNVVRVLSRLRSIGANPKSSLAVTLHWKLAKDLLDPARPGDFNQALMEHGATICLPQNPLCTTCPIRPFCLASTEQTAAATLSLNATTAPVASPDIVEIEDSACDVCGEAPPKSDEYTVTRYPQKVIKKAPRRQDSAVCVVARMVAGEMELGLECLLVQRPATGLLGGLWEFPSVILPRDDDDAVDASYEARAQATKTYVKSVLGHAIPASGGRAAGRGVAATYGDLGSVEHLFSHIRQTYWVEHVMLPVDYQPVRSGEESVSDATPHKWVRADALEAEAVPTGMKKVFGLVVKAQEGAKRRRGRDVGETAVRKRGKR